MNESEFIANGKDSFRKLFSWSYIKYESQGKIFLFCFVFLLWFALITADKRVSYKKHYHPYPKKTKQKKRKERESTI